MHVFSKFVNAKFALKRILVNLLNQSFRRNFFCKCLHTDCTDSKKIYVFMLPSFEQIKSKLACKALKYHGNECKTIHLPLNVNLVVAVISKRLT